MTRAADPQRPTYAMIIHGSRAGDDGLRAAVASARARGVRIRPRVTFELGDAATFAREAAAAGVAAVVAVGGDGTVNEVLNGLAGSDVPLGIVPLGTANDFARQVAIPDDAEHALDLILRSRPVRLDTAELNGRRFLNVSAGGIGAEATAETGAAAKAALGPLAYAFTGLRKLVSLDPHRLRLVGPELEREHDALLFFVGNARESGGGMPVTPLASANDGLLDVCVVEAEGRADLARLALAIRRGEHVGEPGVHYYRLPWVNITARKAIYVNVDGEPVRATELHYRARPGDLLIHLPPRTEAGIGKAAGAGQVGEDAPGVENDAPVARPAIERRTPDDRTPPSR